MTATCLMLRCHEQTNGSEHNGTCPEKLPACIQIFVNKTCTSLLPRELTANGNHGSDFSVILRIDTNCYRTVPNVIAKIKKI